MEYQFKCGNCGAKIDSDTSEIGCMVSCPMCEMDILVPLTNMSSGMVQGDFWIQKQVGSGNLGDVFIAKRNSTSEKVYMKILSRAVVDDQATAEAFLGQMAQWGNVDNPHVLSVHEAGRIAGHFYCITPFVEGECLDKRVERMGPMSEKETIKVAIRIARLLRSCWQDYGLVHGNLRPSNILVDGSGEVYLLDAGNAKAMLVPDGGSLEKVNYSGNVADFMSPEAIDAPDTQDCRSDIYSLGATMFFLLTGQKPYTGSDTTDIIRKHMAAKPPNAAKANDMVSDDMARFIRSVMSKNPAKRITTWRDMIGRLKQILKSRTRRTETSGLLKTAIDQQAIAPAEDVRKQTNTLIRGVIATMVILVLIMVAGIGYILSRHSDRSSPDPGGVQIVHNEPEPPPDPGSKPTDDHVALPAKIYLIDSRKNRVGELLDNMIVTGWGDVEVDCPGQRVEVRFFLDGAEVRCEKRRPYNLLTPVKAGRHTLRVVIANGEVQGELQRTFAVVEKAPGPQLANSARTTGPGLRGEYFNNVDFKGTPVVRVDPRIKFSWKNGAPMPGIPSDRFAVRWVGTLTAPRDGEFTFELNADDRAELLLDGKVLIPYAQGKGHASIKLKKGQRYPIRVRYVENTGAALVFLFWSGPRLKKQFVPSRALSYPQ